MNEENDNCAIVKSIASVVYTKYLNVANIIIPKTQSVPAISIKARDIMLITLAHNALKFTRQPFQAKQDAARIAQTVSDKFHGYILSTHTHVL